MCLTFLLQSTPLTCKTGKCTDSKDKCTGKSGPATTVCNAGEVCGVSMKQTFHIVLIVL